MKRLILLIFVLSLCLISCSQSSESAEQILAAIIAETQDLPAGQVRVLNSPEYDTHYLPINLLRVMLADSEEFGEEEKICELALFLSQTGELCEIAVICADSTSSAEEIAELFSKRVQMLKTSPSLSKENKETAQNAQIIVSGKYVLYAVANSAADIAEIFRAELHS